jgi:hypothetical protein
MKFQASAGTTSLSCQPQRGFTFSKLVRSRGFVAMAVPRMTNTRSLVYMQNLNARSALPGL